MSKLQGPSGVTSGKMRAELYLQKRLNYNGAMTLLQKQSEGEIQHPGNASKLAPGIPGGGKP